MKKRNLIIIGIVVVIGIATLIIANIGGRDATFDQDYHIADPETITKIFLADKENNSILLTRNEDSTWMVDETYPASQPLVDMLLETMNKMRIRSQVNKAAVANIIKDIAANGTKVEVYQTRYFINWFKGKLKLFPHEKLTTTYFVGRETQDQMASYFFREGDKYPFIIHIPGFRGNLTPRFPTDPLAWRSHSIVDWDVRHIQSIEMQITDSPEQSFIVRRKGDTFEMELTATHQVVPQFDTMRIAQLLSSFTQLNFDEFAKAVPQVELDTTFSKAPRTILTITDINGNKRQLKTYLKYSNPNDLKSMPDTAMYSVFDLNRLYAILDDKDTVLIQYYVFDNILQPASFFLGEDVSLY